MRRNSWRVHVASVRLFTHCKRYLATSTAVGLAVCGPAVAELPAVEPGAAEAWERGQSVSPYSTVNLSNGNVLTVIPIVSWSGRGPGVDCRLYHNSADGKWRYSYSRHLEFVNDDEISFVRDDGRGIRFTRVGEEWRPEAGYFLTLTKPDPVGTRWEIRTKDQWTMVFDNKEVGEDALLKQIVDSAGNVLTIDGSPPGGMRVTDAPGRTLRTSFVLDGKIPEFFDEFRVFDDQMGRAWTIGVASGSERVTSIRDPMGFRTAIGYSVLSGAGSGAATDRIGSITDKYELNGPRNSYNYQYHADGRLAQVFDPSPFSHVQTFQYDDSSGRAETRYTNRRGATYTYSYNDKFGGNYNLGAIYEPDKWTLFRYDDDRNLTIRWHQWFEIWRWTYDGNGNTLTATDPEFNTQTWTYDAYNNVTSYTDGEGESWTFGYDVPGVGGPEIDPTALTEVHLPMVETGTDDVIYVSYHDRTQNGLSGHGMVKTVTDPNGVQTRFDYDSRGQLYSETEGRPAPGDTQVLNAVTTRHDFDLATRHVYSKRGGWCGAPPLEGGLSGGNVYNDNDDVVENSCVLGVWPMPGCSQSSVMPGPGFAEYSQSMPSADYDPMGRPTVINGVIGVDGLDDASVRVNMAYDELGRITSLERRTNEACWYTTDPSGNPVLVLRTYSFDYDVPNGITWTTTPDGVTTRVETDLLGRVLKVVAYDQFAPESPHYQADYTYVPYRDLVDTVTYANGTKIVYEYYANGLVKTIRHWVIGAPVPFLELIYTYDGRGLITHVRETDETGIVMTINYDYDARRRLTRETRVGGGPGEYDIAYTYDAGGNRLTKTDLLNGVETTYHYDVEDPVSYGTKANRLMHSETRNGALDVLERVVYEYALEGDAAGNVTQVIREVPLEPGPDPFVYDVFATHFTYNKAAEVRIVTQRHWMKNGGVHLPNTATILKIREFRGTGRERYMMRDRDTAFPHSPDYDSARWTDYNDDLPVADYRVTDCDTGPSAADVADETHYALGTAEIDYCTEGESCTDDAVSYTHTNHLGTTRARTNDASHGGAPGAPIPYERPVYTAFGERIDGDVSTRYGYVGQHGYETMDGYDWGEWQGQPVGFDFIHTGARWYDPSTGRFLQRDPVGIRNDMNVYEYAASRPTIDTDSLGLGNDNDPGWFPGGVGEPRNRDRLDRAISGVEGVVIVEIGVSLAGASVVRHAGRLRHLVRIEAHPIGGLKGSLRCMRLWHINFGKRHLILDARYWWDRLRRLF